MLDEKEIDVEIARLEYVESSYPNYAKLADLYTIRNQMHRTQKEADEYEAKQSYNSTDDLIGQYGESDFLIAVDGKSADKIFGILDELMDTLRVTYPRAYKSVLMKIHDA